MNKSAKPVLVLQHLSADGPAYLGRWLKERGVAWEVVDSEAGAAFPSRIEAYGALAVLGGEMSANDPLPSLRAAESLIRQAVAADVPVIGHCLGGQLMARALGARVRPSPAPEIGWSPLQVAAHDEAKAWFGAERQAFVFQWHFEAFELPPGAQLLASSNACAHQAFGLGPHLALQFHVEVDAAKLAGWSASTDPTFLSLQGRCPSVQSGAAMREQAAQHLAAQQRLADRLYARWLAGRR